MNKICLCIIIVGRDKYYEVVFDGNLSIKDNIKLLSEICDIDINNNYYIMYENKVLKKDIPIKEYCFPLFSRLYLFNDKI